MCEFDVVMLMHVYSFLTYFYTMSIIIELFFVDSDLQSGYDISLMVMMLDG